MIKVLTILGTRPEAIKMAPVVGVLARHERRVQSLVCATGQHPDLLQPILDVFGIRPDYTSSVMRPGQSLGRLTARLLIGLERVVSRVRPDWILAQGDTTSVLAAGLTAIYQGVRFGHVEAGLRSGDRRHPFPEEMNRRAVGTLADLHFAPTERARQALLGEGVAARDIVVTGNPVVDAVLTVASRPHDLSTGPLAGLPHDRRLVLITAHRRENLGPVLEGLCETFVRLATSFAQDAHFVFPVHPNPRVRETAHRILDGIPNLSLVDPLDYPSMVHLMKRAHLILTDSGGIQEEAPSLGVPVLVLRDVTERPEGLETGWVRLVGTQPDRILLEASRCLREPPTRPDGAGANPYGDGRAAERIVAALLARSGIDPTER